MEARQTNRNRSVQRLWSLVYARSSSVQLIVVTKKSYLESSSNEIDWNPWTKFSQFKRERAIAVLLGLLRLALSGLI